MASWMMGHVWVEGLEWRRGTHGWEGDSVDGVACVLEEDIA